MINSLISGISEALYSEFGEDYEIYKESVEQGLNEPCFLISCLNPTNNLFLGERYFRENQFCIQYFPSTAQENTECFSVLDRLWSCMEIISVDGSETRGTSMSGEMTNDILSFFVNYDMFVYVGETEETVMEEFGVVTGA